MTKIFVEKFFKISVVSIQYVVAATSNVLRACCMFIISYLMRVFSLSDLLLTSVDVLSTLNADRFIAYECAAAALPCRLTE